MSLRRGLRAALIVSLLLAFATRLGLDQSFATFLVFGGMALLVLADFGGPSRSRVLAYLTTVLVGIPLVASARSPPATCGQLLLPPPR